MVEIDTSTWTSFENNGNFAAICSHMYQKKRIEQKVFAGISI